MKLKFLAPVILLTPLFLTTPIRAENPEHVRRLLKTKECQGCDLSGADLRGADLSFAILVGADLTRANLRGANLTQADLRRSNLSQTDLRQASLDRADLTNANLSRTSLVGASLIGSRGLPIMNLASGGSGLVSLPPLPPLQPAPPPVVPPPPLLLSLPQLAEARNYFQQRWKPPEGLTQPLEYSLWLNSDGSIQRIVPLGNAAIEHLNRTNMPLLGEPFVSAIQGERNFTIRVVLNPNGNVQTFQDRDFQAPANSTEQSSPNPVDAPKPKSKI